MLNFGVLKSWQNWLLVLFSIIVLMFILHAFFRNTNNVPAFSNNSGFTPDQQAGL